MAIVSLGNNILITGFPEIAYSSFSYNQRRAYGIIVQCASPDFNNIFSYLRMSALIEPNSLIPFKPTDTYQFDIIPQQQMALIPMSRLFDGNGDCTLFLERIPYWRGAGDRTEVTVELSYNNMVDVPSWRD